MRAILQNRIESFLVSLFRDENKKRIIIAPIAPKEVTLAVKLEVYARKISHPCECFPSTEIANFRTRTCLTNVTICNEQTHREVFLQTTNCVRSRFFYSPTFSFATHICSEVSEFWIRVHDQVLNNPSHLRQLQKFVREQVVSEKLKRHCYHQQ